jgi:hypothetical protein
LALLAGELRRFRLHHPDHLLAAANDALTLNCELVSPDAHPRALELAWQQASKLVYYGQF